MARYTRGRKLDGSGDSKHQKPSRISGNNTNNMKRGNNSNMRTSNLKELQDILNIKVEPQQLTQPRTVGYAQQNIQFARENTSLRTKITELELKLNDLLKENLQLRQNSVSNKIQYENHLSEQICLLENGVFQRFDEIILMFDNVRKRENLPPNESSQWKKYHQQIDTPTVLKNVTMTPAKKRNRRKSMFIQSDDLPLLDTVQNDDKENIPHHSSISETVIHESSIPVLGHPDNISNEESENVSIKQNDLEPLQDVINNENTGTSSILEYPIPEENEGNDEENDVNIILPSDKSIENIKKTSTPPTEQVKKSGNSTTSTSKKTQRKHIAKMPPPIIKKTKKHSISKDDKMPETNIDVNEIETISNSTVSSEENVSEVRSFRRSTRGKVVNYKLPSLRAKMRRPKEKLVDATTVNDIHEYEVNIKIEPKHDELPHKITPAKTEPVILKEKTVTTPKKAKPKKKMSVCKSNSNKEEKPTNKDIPNDSIIESADNTSNDIITIPIPKKKTSVYNDIDSDSIDFFVNNNDYDIFSTPVGNVEHTNNNNKKRNRNSLLDDDDDDEKENGSKTCIPLPKKEFEHRYAFNLKTNKNGMSSSPLMSSKISSSSNQSSSQVLSDITNKTVKVISKKPKKKLLKRAIINDLYNDAEDLDIYDSLNKKSPSPSLSSSSAASFRSLSSSFHYQGSSANKSEKESKTVSFRFSDDDLSVFDLVDKQHNNKRAKVKEVGK